MKKIKQLTAVILAIFAVCWFLVTCESEGSRNSEPARYTVTLKAGDGTGADKTYCVTGGSFTLPNGNDIFPSTVNKMFNGWAKDSAATTAKYNAGDVIQVTENITLYALWVSVFPGTVIIDNMSPIIGDTLTASPVDDSIPGTLSFTWKVGGMTVGADSDTYTVQNKDVAKPITAEIRSSEQEGIFTSAPTALVGRGFFTGQILKNDILSDADKPPSYIARDVVLSPRSVELRHQSDPANNGKMYLTYCSGDTPDNGKTAFPVFESVDGGRTFSAAPVGYVKDTNNGWGNDNCPDLYELPERLGTLEKGTLICVGIATTLNYTETSLDVYYSVDLGRNWVYLSTVATGGANIAGQEPLWEPHLLYDPAGGRLVCYYSDETDPRHSQKLVLKYTTDGINWSEVIPVAQFNGQGERPGMFIVKQLEDGHYIAVMELIGQHHTGVPSTFKFSLYPDDPVQWNEKDWGAEFSSGWGSPYIAIMADGTIVANSFTNNNFFINTRKDGLGRWVSTPSPVRTGYNRQHYQLSSGELFVNSAPIQGDWPKNVWYGTRAAPSITETGSDTSSINTLTVTAEGRGTVSRMGSFQVNSTTPYWLEAIPDDGAAVREVFVNGTSRGNVVVFKVNVTANTTVHVIFQ